MLSTEASKLGIGAILSQLQNGVWRPIGYASRQKKKADKMYSASESELLPSVWATKHFRCYLLDKKLLVWTDHATLIDLQKFFDQNIRLLRCSRKLSELGISVEHRPG